MTDRFRAAAYAAVAAAEAQGAGLDDPVVVQATPGVWEMRLRDLKQQLHRDRLRQKRRKG